MSVISIPTSSCALSIGEPIRQAWPTVLTIAQLEALDMAASNNKQGEK